MKSSHRAAVPLLHARCFDGAGLVSRRPRNSPARPQAGTGYAGMGPWRREQCAMASLFSEKAEADKSIRGRLVRRVCAGQTRRDWK